MAEEPEPVEVVYATAGAQRTVTVPWEAGLTAELALERSGLRRTFPEIDTLPRVLAIFNVRVPPDQRLEPGDRVEICRPLQRDPRDFRRSLAGTGAVMGKPGRKGR